MSYTKMTITAGKPVTGDQLIGREKEIRLIGKYLDMGQSVVLIAPRRFGKTSLLLEMLHRKKAKGNFTIFVDFFSTPDLFSLAAEITTHLSPFTNHHSPFTTHHSPLTIHHSPLTTHHSPFTTHHSPLTILGFEIVKKLIEGLQMLI